jgi:predicted glycoside hydrolase/deacetylase ChbG (UPF0249 family)
MKKFYAIVYSMLLVLYSFAQKTRLIVRGDDMGFSHSGNVALIKCYKEGIQKSIEVIVPSPWFPEAVKMLKENPGADVGIHLALTSEWETIKYRPLTDCPSLRDSNGYFFPMAFPNKNYPGKSIKENNWNMADVEKELRAQIELAKRLIPNISHVSSHMGATYLSEDLKALVRKLCKEYNIAADPELELHSSIGFEGPHATPTEKVTAFIKMLDKLEAGKTYIFIEHPGIDNDELRAIYHIGYENVAADRQGITDLYTNPAIKEAIKKKGIELISYADTVK